MKSINKFLLSAGIVAASLGFGACTGDLDLLPGDPNDITAGAFAENPELYLDELIANVFFQHATYGANGNSPIHSFDGGMATFSRAIFIIEEIPSDEACWLPAADADYGTMQYGIVDATNKAATVGYSRFMVDVACCIDFIRTADAQFNDFPEVADKVKKYRLMAQTLWGLNYFYLLSDYGNVPYADENTAIGETPAQLTRAEVFNRVAAKMEQVVADWKAAGLENDVPVYGYLGIDAAQACLVRLYLNAEAWGAGDKYADCLKHAQEIIKRHQGTGLNGTGLAHNYSQLFAQNNDQFAPGGGGINEFLWSIPAKRTDLLSWAGSTLLTAAWLGEVKDCKLADFNVSGAWKCMVARQQFSEVFDWKDDAKSESDDQRVRFWVTSKHGFAIENPSIAGQDMFGDNGYLPIKFTNWVIDENGNIDAAASGAAVEQLGSDYPVIRLAEIYLSAAEAILHGAGNKADALTYVNNIRSRAGLTAWTAGQLTEESLQQERQRELYTEGLRRTDLVRYGKWVSGYTWNWKGMAAEGTDFPAHFNLYPLPSAVVSKAGYKQNPGY